MSDYSSLHDESKEALPHKKRQKLNDPIKGFRLTGAAKEKHSSKLYSISWSSDLFCSSSAEIDSSKDASDAHFRYFATCGGKYVSIYEVEVDIPRNGTSECQRQHDGGFRAHQVYIDADKGEDYYTCVFGGRGVGASVGYGPISIGHENENGNVLIDSSGDSMIRSDLLDVAKNDGPQLLLVAGERGVIKIIDTVYRRLFMTLSGHGDAVYDLKMSPLDPWLVLSSSKDESIRLWNFMNASCIAVFTGHEAHKSNVLSVSWHPLGKMFASSSMDTSIKIWSLETLPIQENLSKSRSISTRSRMITGRYDEHHIALNPVFEQLPIFSTNKMHLDYVDCVQFVGDLLLSKSPRQVISLWKPDLGTSTGDCPVSSASLLASRLQRENVTPFCLRDFEVSRCDIWFIRFQTDSSYHYLACGNNNGEIKVWDLESKARFTLSTPQCTEPVRMVSFSPDQDSLIAVCDDSTIWKWDLRD